MLSFQHKIAILHPYEPNNFQYKLIIRSIRPEKSFDNTLYH